MDATDRMDEQAKRIRDIFGDPEFYGPPAIRIGDEVMSVVGVEDNGVWVRRQGAPDPVFIEWERRNAQAE